MNKFKQCIYTFTLLLICLVASPMIYKKIWDTSAEKKKVSSDKPPVIDIYANDPANTATTAAPPDGASQPVTEGASQPENTEAPLQPTESAPTDSDPATTATTEAVSPAVQYVKADASYFDDALFIGDSRTVGLRDYGTLKNADYYCDVGTAAWNINIDALNEKLRSKNYGKVYLMLGINEIGNNFETTMRAYESLLEDVKAYVPDAVIYLSANLHVTSAAQTAAITNERIDYLNNRISGLADNERVFYIDINPVFNDQNGALRQDCTGDGIHVYGKYYSTWCDWLCANTVSR